jgi:hypothetical protein
LARKFLTPGLCGWVLDVVGSGAIALGAIQDRWCGVEKPALNDANADGDPAGHGFSKNSWSLQRVHPTGLSGGAF